MLKMHCIEICLVGIKEYVYFLPKFLEPPCQAGKYKSADMTTCEVCEEGSVSSTTGATSCTACDPGQEANTDKTSYVVSELNILLLKKHIRTKFVLKSERGT